MAYRIQFRRDTQANWESNNPILLQGEFAYSLDTGFAKIGDGSSTWSQLIYFGGTGPTGPIGPTGAEGPSSSIVWQIGASGSADYVFTGPGIVAGNTDDPVLYLYKGFTYVFVNNVGANHPFAIRESSGGAAYTPGVSGSQTGTQTFIVPMDAPATLYYQCTNHSGMGNTINIG